MPNKYPEKKGWDVPKQKYKLSNWSEYNDSLRRRGSIDVWLSDDAIITHSPNAELVIPPRANAVERDNAAEQRNRNIREIDEIGRMQWQRDREYGRRNYSELGVQRYQKLFGDALHARDISRQKQEAILACGALNKMTPLGMPQSYRSA